MSFVDDGLKMRMSVRNTPTLPPMLRKTSFANAQVAKLTAHTKISGRKRMGPPLQAEGSSSGCHKQRDVDHTFAKCHHQRVAYDPRRRTISASSCRLSSARATFGSSNFPMKSR